MKNTKLVHEVRAVKNAQELENIIIAQRISEKVLGVAVRALKTGVSELHIANLIENAFVKYGAPILAFPPIVAFGKNTASIHHTPSKTKLKKGDMIMFDFGCTVKHYCSDMTRTYFWGEPSKKQAKVYNDVLEAQERAIKKLESGERKAKAVDKVARDFLNKKYGVKNFLHGLGHGVGTVIHEWPNFKPKSEDVLPVGCVMTVEPGIYLKGFGGVRIEDMVLITEKGCTNLTNVPNDLKSVTLK